MNQEKNLEANHQARLAENAKTPESPESRQAEAFKFLDQVEGKLVVFSADNIETIIQKSSFPKNESAIDELDVLENQERDILDSGREEILHTIGEQEKLKQVELDPKLKELIAKEVLETGSLSYSSLMGLRAHQNLHDQPFQHELLGDFQKSENLEMHREIARQLKTRAESSQDHNEFPELSRLAENKMNSVTILEQMANFPGNTDAQWALMIAAGEIAFYEPESKQLKETPDFALLGDHEFSKMTRLRRNTLAAPELVTISRLDQAMKILERSQQPDSPQNKKAIAAIEKIKTQLVKELAQEFPLEDFDSYAQKNIRETAQGNIHAEDLADLQKIADGELEIGSTYALDHYYKMLDRSDLNRFKKTKISVRLLKAKQELARKSPVIPETAIKDEPQLESLSNLNQQLFESISASGIFAKPLFYTALDRPQQAYLQNEILAQITASPDFDALPDPMKDKVRDLQLRLREELCDDKKSFVPTFLGRPLRVVISQEYVTNNNMKKYLQEDSSLIKLSQKYDKEDCGGYYSHQDNSITIINDKVGENAFKHESSHALDYSIFSLQQRVQGEYQANVSKPRRGEIEFTSPKPLSNNEQRDLYNREQFYEMLMTETIARLHESTSAFPDLPSIKNVIMGHKIYALRPNFDGIRDQVTPEADDFYKSFDGLDLNDAKVRYKLATYLALTPFSTILKDSGFPWKNIQIKNNHG